MVGSSHKARTPAVETTATSTNLPAFAAPEMDVPQKKIAGILTDESLRKTENPTDLCYAGPGSERAEEREIYFVFS